MKDKTDTLKIVFIILFIALLVLFVYNRQEINNLNFLNNNCEDRVEHKESEYNRMVESYQECFREKTAYMNKCGAIPKDEISNYLYPNI